MRDLHNLTGNLVGGGREPGLFEKGVRRNCQAWFFPRLRVRWWGREAEPEWSPEPPASLQTPWVLCACQLRSKISQGAHSAGCLAGATPTPATVSQLPGPWVQKGWGSGGASSPKVTHLYLPCPPPPLGQMAVPTPFFSGVIVGLSLPCLGLPGRTPPEFPLKPGLLYPCPFSGLLHS